MLKSTNSKSASKASATKAVAKRTPPPKLTFTAKNEIKTFHAELTFRTDIDGFVSNRGLGLTVIKGRPGSDRAEEFDLLEANPQIAAAAIARFMLVTYAANITKRLPTRKQFRVLMRVTVTRDFALRCTVREIHTGKNFAVFLEDKTDPLVRRLRRCAKFFQAAFQEMPSFEDLGNADE